MNVHNGHVDNLLVSNCQHTCIVTVECRFSNMYNVHYQHVHFNMYIINMYIVHYQHAHYQHVHYQHVHCQKVPCQIEKDCQQKFNLIN